MTQIYGSERARRTISKGKRLLGQSLDEPARVSKRPLPGESRSSELEPHTQPPCAGNSRDVNPVSLSQVQRRQTNKQNKTVKQKHEREFMLHRNELLSSENASNLAVWVPAGLTTMSKHIRDLDQNSAGPRRRRGRAEGQSLAGEGDAPSTVAGRLRSGQLGGGLVAGTEAAGFGFLSSCSKSGSRWGDRFQQPLTAAQAPRRAHLRPAPHPQFTHDCPSITTPADSLRLTPPTRPAQPAGDPRNRTHITLPPSRA